MSKLVTVKIGTYPNELALVKPYLEDNGIMCFIQDENINQIYPIGAFGGAKLQVAEEDADLARQLLIQGGYSTAEDYEG